MRVMTYRSYGGALEAAEMPRPTPQSGQLLVRARYSSVNPVDWKIASGKLRMLMPVSLPAVPGFDIAGEVEEIGPGVGRFRVGDKVHARILGGAGGASAEYAIVGEDVAAKVPDTMDLADAAAIPLAGMTALQGLRDEASMRMKNSPDRVLVVGASGGVGHFAVQIARAAGAKVTGVCSARNAELVASLGAQEIIDYTKPDAFAGKGPWDVVLDCVGGSPSAWTKHLAAGGRFASCMPGPSVFMRAALNVFTSRRVRAVMLKANATDLMALDAMFEEKMLRAVIDSRFPLSKLADAWERSKSGRAAGKIIVEIDG